MALVGNPFEACKPFLRNHVSPKSYFARLNQEDFNINMVCVAWYCLGSARVMLKALRAQVSNLPSTHAAPRQSLPCFRNRYIPHQLSVIP